MQTEHENLAIPKTTFLQMVALFVLVGLFLGMSLFELLRLNEKLNKQAIQDYPKIHEHTWMSISIRVGVETKWCSGCKESE